MKLNSENIPIFDNKGRIVIQFYDRQRPFSSFLPGIGGLFGIPIWVFYNNRGQAISSFGIESKDRPILEFQPANKAYASTASMGFRTFLKGDPWTYEPFSPWARERCQRDMHVGMNEVELVEKNPVKGLETRVSYFNIVNEGFAALARILTFRNFGDAKLDFKVLDGLPAVIPFGVDDGMLKSISRTIEAWMQVENVENYCPYFTMRMSAGDTSEVEAIEGGNFALGISDGDLLPVFVDPVFLFGSDTTFTYPNRINEDLEHLIDSEQIVEGRTPCCFFGSNMSLEPGEEADIASIYGFVHQFSDLQKSQPYILSPGFFNHKREEAQELIMDLTAPAEIRSGDPLFDYYTRQTFLDNVIRGGWPEIIGKDSVYHVFSRKHGDPERDYNYFTLTPENYSQGNSNFRDVNQNRRNEIFYNPQIGDFNIRLFMSLIQTDGYNPLIVKGTKFTLEPEKRPEILKLVHKPEDLEEVLSGEFSPGEVLHAINECGLSMDTQDFLDLVIDQSEQHIQAEHGEGFWIDHWTYNLDLIESFLAVFPDKKKQLLFNSEPVPFFDNPFIVNPRDKKYVLVNGEPRQHNGIEFCKEKSQLIETRKVQPNWTRTKYGRGEVFRIPLFSKLITLAVLKFSTLDPYGMGIEMEAGRPGWCDALNGLPSLFGSSLSETMELLRLLNFIQQTLEEYPRSIELPVEINDLLRSILNQLEAAISGFEYWNAVSTAREEYRQKTKLGVSGDLVKIPPTELQEVLLMFKAKLSDGITCAVKENSDLPPTYFRYDLVDYEHTGIVDEQGRIIVIPKEFKQHRMPLYLEGPVGYLKLLEDKSQAEATYKKVKRSGLYDHKLNMYKLNTSLLDQTYEIGRARVFSPGWLENESVWLHMSYKYLLEILRAGFYEEFFSEMKTNMPPYMDLATYGRSPAENSSFIVSSAHPDPTLHGAGFVARLSGTTAEFLSMLHILLVGCKTFSLDTNGELQLEFHPVLPGGFFDQNNTLSFKFLGQCEITYHNPGKRDTYSLDSKISKHILYIDDGSVLTLEQELIPSPYAEMVRSGRIPRMNVFIS